MGVQVSGIYRGFDSVRRTDEKQKGHKWGLEGAR